MARHPVDLLSLVSGLLILALGLLLLSGGLGGLQLEWVGPLIAIGLGLLVAIGARPARHSSEQEPSPTDEPRI